MCRLSGTTYLSENNKICELLEFPELRSRGYPRHIPILGIVNAARDLRVTDRLLLPIIQVVSGQHFIRQPVPPQYPHPPVTIFPAAPGS